MRQRLTLPPVDSSTTMMFGASMTKSLRVRNNSDIGRVDPMFVDLSRSYRSIVIDGLSKLVYFVEDDIIYIAAFLDTRRLPSMMADIESR